MTQRRIYINPNMIQGDSKEEKKHLRTTVQHEYGHYIFFENMGQHSEVWGNWWSKLSKKMVSVIADLIPGTYSGPQKMIIISYPYQELFSDLLTTVTQKDPDVTFKLVEYFQSGKEANVNRKFDVPFLETQWGDKEKHGTLAPVRSFLWEEYFADSINEGREPQIVKAIFDIIALEIIARSEDPKLHELTPEEVNFRLLKALQFGLADFRHQ